MLVVVSQTEERQKGIGIAGRPMTQTIAFLQQAALPGDLTATLSCLQVTTVIVDLGNANIWHSYQLSLCVSGEGNRQHK